MSDPTRAKYLADPRFLRNHGLSRRDVLRLGAAGSGAMLLGGVPHHFAAPAAAQDTVTGGDIEVGVFYEEGPWFDHAKAIGDSLEKDYPGTKVKYTFANTASDSARNLRWQNGDPLDVDTGRWSSQAPILWDWVNNGFVQDLTSYLDQPLASGDKWSDTFTSGAKSFAVDNRADSTTPGAWWGVPWEMVYMLVHYNVQIFEDMGVQPANTWSEFLTLCQTINEKGKDKGIKPICVSGPTDVYCGHWWDRMIQRIVGREEVEKVAFGEGHLADNPGFLTAAQEIAKLPQNDWFMEGYEGADFTTAQAIYFQGKAAMIHMGSWLAAEMKDAIPPDYRLGVFDFPTYDGGTGDQSAMFGTAQMWSVANPGKATSHQPNVPLAAEYLKRWTSVENQTSASNDLRMIPSINGVPAPTGTTGMDKMVEKSATSDVIIYYYGIHWDTALWAAWYQPVQALFLKKIGPEEMVAQIDKNLDEYRQVKKAGG
ncbi:MAG TPA: substrate-binding domain-containing protein [Thermomicrobiales bacterium]|jgi:raffinose/stachyose/melibiose transport system substrate-binding protein